MIDTELFIIEIEKNECIWNVTSKCFMDRDLKRKAWSKISSVIIQNWENLPEEERGEQS